MRKKNLWHSVNHRKAYVDGRNRSGGPKAASLLLKGQKLPVNVIYLKKQLRLFLPKNTPRLQLLSAERLRKVNNILSNQRKLRERRAVTERNNQLKISDKAKKKLGY